MPANEREVGVTAKLQEAEAVKVDEFKYPGVNHQKQQTREVKRRAQAGWRGWSPEGLRDGSEKCFHVRH